MRGVVVGDIEGPPKCFAGVYHQLLALQWHIRGKARSRLDCGEEFHVSPPRFKRHVHDNSGLLALNGYRSGVIDILIGSVRHIGWHIVGRQAIWWEGMLVFRAK